MTRRTFSRVLIALAIFTLLAFVSQTPVDAAPPVDLHCPAGWTSKIEAPDPAISGPTVTIPVTMDLCVKAANSNSGIIFASTFTVNWLNHGGQIPDISYVVFYTPEPSKDPLPSPSDDDLMPLPGPIDCHDHCAEDESSESCAKDDPCWDCQTMGNQQCGPATPLLPDTAMTEQQAESNAMMPILILLLVATNLASYGAGKQACDRRHAYDI